MFQLELFYPRILKNMKEIIRVTLKMYILLRLN